MQAAGTIRQRQIAAGSGQDAVGLRVEAAPAAAALDVPPRDDTPEEGRGAGVRAAELGLLDRGHQWVVAVDVEVGREDPINTCLGLL